MFLPAAFLGIVFAVLPNAVSQTRLPVQCRRCGLIAPACRPRRPGNRRRSVVSHRCPPIGFRRSSGVACRSARSRSADDSSIGIYLYTYHALDMESTSSGIQSMRWGRPFHDWEFIANSRQAADTFKGINHVGNLVAERAETLSGGTALRRLLSRPETWRKRDNRFNDVSIEASVPAWSPGRRDRVSPCWPPCSSSTIEPMRRWP